MIDHPKQSNLTAENATRQSRNQRDLPEEFNRRERKERRGGKLQANTGDD
jgi:hypothetical protein